MIFKSKIFSRFMGISIISISIIFFTYSLKSNIKLSIAKENTSSVEMRISADQESKKLYLWGAENGLSVRSSAKIEYQYLEGFYIILIEDVNMAYLLEVYDNDKLIASFRHFTDEKYPIYPQ